MRYQKDPYSCGPAAIVNALRCFGRKVSELKVRGYTETTPESGTSEEGLVRAITALRFQAEPFEKPDPHWAVQFLRKALSSGPVIICTQNAQHWVTVIGQIDDGDRFIVADPIQTQRNLAENGMHVLSEKELLATWQCRAPETGYYGIRVSRRKRLK